MSANLTFTMWPERERRTVAEILDYLARRFDTCGDNEWRNVLAKGALTDALQRIWNEYDSWTWAAQQGQFTTEAGIASYAVDPGWIRLAPVMEVVGLNQPIYEVSQSEYTEKNITGQNYVHYPIRFYRSGQNMVTFQPVPSGEYTIKWDGFLEPTWLVSDELAPLPLPEKLYFLAKQGAEEILHAADNRFDTALRWMGSRFQVDLERAIFMDKRGQKRAMTPRPQPPFYVRHSLLWTYGAY